MRDYNKDALGSRVWGGVYLKAIVDKLGLRFEEGVEFGEDRLFNYAFIKGCGRIVTSSIVMLSYLQRSEDSQSSRHVEHYFERVMGLYEAKMACFLDLAQNTTEEERLDFRAWFEIMRPATCTSRRCRWGRMGS